MVQEASDKFGDMGHIVSKDVRSKFQAYSKQLDTLVADLQPTQSSTNSKKPMNSKKPKEKQEKADRTSKGRGIKLVTIPKLVNFCAATPERIPWDHERRTELFKSVFQY